MNSYAIKVENLWKEFTVGSVQRAPDTFYEVLTGALSFRKKKSTFSQSQFWALRGMDFEVARGEILGLVGRNGAGKSTLLKILSRITAPTQGRIRVRGRIASLLEVGTGFHPELTGRENIFLNATILGMRRAEIERKLDAIVDFSGVEAFLDTPVKRYSSGMYVRLAFSVAAHVDADILLVDEVLAVGDAEFQKRCLGIMGDVARGGRTVLFVSHNLTALRNLCTTGLLLEQGQVRARGAIGDVLNRYASSDAAQGQVCAELAPGPPEQVAYARRVRVNAQDANEEISVDRPFTVVVDVVLRESNVDLGVYLHCHDAAQNRVFSSGSFFEESLNGVRLDRGHHSFTCEIPANLLNNGEYSIDVMLIRDRSEVIVTDSAVLTFQVHDAVTGVEGWNWPILGVIRPHLTWACEASAS